MKRRVLAMFLSMAMAFTMLPAMSLRAEGNAAAGKAEEAGALEASPKAEEGEFGVNLARSATATAPHTNQYGNFTTAAINDGRLATGETSTSWNCWGAAADLYPMPVTLTWEQAQTMSSMRIMWWAYHDGGVVFPSSAEVQYLDGEEWKKIADIGLEHGGVDGADGVWNNVNFDAPVTTTALRVVADRENKSAGIGISEWEVYGEAIPERITGASISGPDGVTAGATGKYTGSAVPAKLSEGAAYEWSIATGEDIIEIEGASNASEVSVKGIKAGEAVLHLKVTKDGVSKETEYSVRVIENKISSIDVYKTSTAAGIAPILPGSVVANGIEFDHATPKTTGKFDFGEEFNSRLIPVTWEAVNASDYAVGKAGTTFTVKGTATYGGEEFEAVAEISVKNPVVVAESNSSVTFENVQLEDAFWSHRQETNAITSLNKAISEIAKATGGEPNFDNAIKKLNGQPYNAFSGFVFQDSDIYKSIEAISYTLSATQNDNSAEMTAQRKVLEDKLNSWIEKIEKVQYADGYIDTYFTLRGSGDGGGPTPMTHRWQDFSRHEMYNAGHFLEGVVAYTRYREGINKPDYRLYVAGRRFANEIVSLFGPDGTRHEVPGHEEIELAMVKFGKLVEEYEGEGTGQPYFDTVKVLVDRRGESASLRESGYKGDTYSQDRTPFKEETNAVGHAVRANYFYTGVTDIATLLPEGNADRDAYIKSLDTIWESVTQRKTYITGGIGTTTAGSDSEGFGRDYDLPPNQSYCETCAAIGSANWNLRMNLLHEDGKYADMVETNLYNSILVGTNLDGNLFYYDTLLEVDRGKGRSNWFNCACCPPNLMRTIASLSGYMYTVHGNTLFVNMYSGSNGLVNVGGTQVGLKQETDYPWDGAVKMTVSLPESKEFAMKIRIPGWVNEQKNKNVAIKVNGQSMDVSVEKGYATINGTWDNGDVVTIDIPMEIRMTEAHEKVVANKGRIALQRGPVVYCMEKAGNAQLNAGIENFNPLNFVIPRDAELTATRKKDYLKDIVEITGDVKYATGNESEMIDAKLQAIPYYAWNNRGDDAEYVPGQGKNSSSKMLIWTMADTPIVKEISVRNFATPSVSFVGWGMGADRFADGVEGTFWNGHSDKSLETGGSQWMMYDFGGAKAELTESRIWFFDDGGGVMLPKGIKIEYEKEDGSWAEVTKAGEWTYKAGEYVTYPFEKIVTSKIRVTMDHAVVGGNKVAVAVNEWDLTGTLIVDRQPLTDAVASVESKLGGLNQVDYTAESWDNLQSALAKAKGFLARPIVSQKQLDDAKSALEDADAKLERKEPAVDKNALASYVANIENKIKGLNQNDYTTESWSKLQAALANAKEILGNANATQAQVDAAKAALEDAEAKLSKKPVVTPSVDKAKLNSTIASAKKYKKDKYTAASWKAFSTALSAAQKVAADKNATQAKVNDAASKLQKAVKALIKLKVTATKKATLGKGEKYSVAAKNCTYTTSNKKVATVNSKGAVVAKGTGKATVKAINKNGKVTVYNLTVKKAPSKISKVTPSKKTLKKGKKVTLKVKLPSGTASNKITFTSSNKKVATVSSKGVVVAKKKGTATVTVKTFNKKSKKVKITVK